MRILIADDHGIVRSGLRLLLDRQPDMEVVAEAADGAEAVELALRERPDCASSTSACRGSPACRRHARSRPKRPR